MQDRVVVVGAGFAGLNAARELANRPVEVTVVDRHNYHLFQPLLYQVATAGLDAQDIAHSVRGILQDAPNVRFRLGSVESVDWDVAGSGAVRLEDGATIGFDWLVVAAGAETNTFGVPGADEHAFALKTLDDSVRLRDHVLFQFERADADPDLVKEGALTFVVVGAGPTGIELTGAFVELFDHVLRRDFRDLDVSRAQIILVEALPSVLNGYTEPTRQYALGEVRSRGVDVRLDSTIARVGAEGVELADGSWIPSRTVVWSAGVRAVPLAGRLGFEQARAGRIVVQEDLSVRERPNVFVVGDMAAAFDGDGDLYPQLAPVAIQQARHAVRQIALRRAGRPTEPFRYVDRGTMATIGRHAAVAELPPLGAPPDGTQEPWLRLRGPLAWLAWLFLHLVQLIGFRNRASVLLNWLYNYVTYDRGARLIVREPVHDPIRGPTGAVD